MISTWCTCALSHSTVGHVVRQVHIIDFCITRLFIIADDAMLTREPAHQCKSSSEAAQRN